MPPFPSRRIDSRAARRAGYTLVEVVVAMLVSCVMVTAVFSVALTSKSGSGKGDRRMMATQSAAQLTAMIKGYVTACGCRPDTGACPAGCALPGLLGPNIANAGVATWYIDGGGIVDSAGPVYALKCGTHVLTGPGIVPPALSAPAFNANVTYTVTYPGGCPSQITATTAPQVDVNVNWTEP